MTSDWKEVYRQERQRPGYVIEDGRMPRGRQQDASIKRVEIALGKPGTLTGLHKHK